jgi:G3E family GTPase
MTPLVLFVGFLGSGKTTFLKKLLPALQQHGVSPHVIINDYQNAKVDAEQLRGLASEIAAISGDCVCCGSRDELLAALEKFEHAPGRLVLVETNGTTDSEHLIEMLALEPGLKKFTQPVQLSVIDAQRWQKRFWHNALEREQARTASHIFLSRADTVSITRLRDVEQSLDAQHVRGRKVTVEEFATELSSLGKEAASAGERTVEPCDRCGGHHENSDHHHHGHKHAHSDHHFSSLELPLPDRVSRKALSHMLRHLPGEVIRAKGLVRFHEETDEFFVFQKVEGFDEPQFFPVGNTPKVNTPLALFIGPGLPEEKIRAAVRALEPSL